MLGRFPSEIDAMPLDDYYDLCALLSLEPTPSAKIDIGLSNLAVILAQLLSDKSDSTNYDFASWLKLGAPESTKDKVNRLLDSGMDISEIMKDQDILEYNKQVAGGLPAALEAAGNAAKKQLNKQ